MSNLGFEQQEIPVRVGALAHSFVLRTPPANRLAPDPALMIHLALDVPRTLDEPIHRLASDVFLAVGHRIGCFDLPGHGGWKLKHGDALNGIAAAMAAGQDVFGEIGRVGLAVVDACIERRFARSGHIVFCGTSRGGLAALHVMAGDDRIAAAALFAPVTHLPALPSHVGFDPIADAPLVRASNALSLVDRIAARPIAISINTNDVTVSTEHCLRFRAALCAAAPSVEHPLYITPGDSHNLPLAGYQFGAAFLLQRCARASRV